MITNNKFFNLPNEILIGIFEYLPAQDIFPKLSITCKRINELINTEYFSEYLIKRDFFKIHLNFLKTATLKISTWKKRVTLKGRFLGKNIEKPLNEYILQFLCKKVKKMAGENTLTLENRFIGCKIVEKLEYFRNQQFERVSKMNCISKKILKNTHKLDISRSTKIKNFNFFVCFNKKAYRKIPKKYKKNFFTIVRFTGIEEKQLNIWYKEESKKIITFKNNTSF